MTNREIYDIVTRALVPEFNEAVDRHKRLDLTIRIDDRDIRMISNYRHTKYDLLDADTGEMIGVQHAHDSLTEIDVEWWNKQCEVM